MGTGYTDRYSRRAIFEFDDFGITIGGWAIWKRVRQNDGYGEIVERAVSMGGERCGDARVSR